MIQKRRLYRKKFKFDSSVEGKTAYHAYKMACKFGIHGHLTSQIFSKAVEWEEGNEYEVREVKEEGILVNSQIWISSLIFLYSYLIDWESLPKSNETRELHEAFYALMLHSEKYIKDLDKID